MSAPREMALIGFMQAQNCSTYPGSWRHAASMQDFTTPEYFQRIARVLEEGKFQMAFFDDRLAMPDIYGRDHEASVADGVRVVKMDTVPILTAMGLATSRLGLGATYSTTYYEPYHVARCFGTLDLMTRGRAAWNVVTSMNDSEAANFGRAEHMEHDLRYDRADEFVEVVLGLWDSWDETALELDKGGRFADPAKVKRLDHHGRFFDARGPLSVPRSPQGHPVLIQAGQSGRGREFAARWGELIFVVFPNIGVGKQQYALIKQSLAAAGRDPALTRVAPAVYAVVAESEQAAVDKRAYIDSLAKPGDCLALLCEVLNTDFSTRGIDEPFTDAEMAAISGWTGFRDRIVAMSGRKNPTVRDFIDVSGRGRIREFPVFQGTPKTVADQMEEWITGDACDGFVLSPTHMPGAYEDFVRLVVPELQRRGLFQKEYKGKTLRENLGLPIPKAGDWRAVYGEGAPQASAAAE